MGNTLATKIFVKTCIDCGVLFRGGSGASKRCDECMRCLECGARVKRSGKRYCSRSCAGRAAYRDSPAARSALAQGRSDPKRVERVREAIARTRGVSQPNISGPRHWNWKGGKPDARYGPGDHAARARYRLWRRAVLERDGWMCRRCRRKNGVRVVAHHVWRWSDHPEMRFDVANGVTLCQDCHKAEHATGHDTLRPVRKLSL